MSTLIPVKQWEEIRKLNVRQLVLLKACEVYDGDENRGENYLFTLLPHNPYDSVVADNIRTKAEYLGMSSNSIYPNRPEEVQSLKQDKYPNLTKARATRKANIVKRKELVNA